LGLVGVTTYDCGTTCAASTISSRGNKQRSSTARANNRAHREVPVAEGGVETQVEVEICSVPTPPELSESAIELTAKIADIIDRILWLRAYWATTLAPEVDRECEAWRARLQRLASKLEISTPPLTNLLSPVNIHLLAPLRDMTKPTIPQNLQQS